jgi:hypothetical protein
MSVASQSVAKAENRSLPLVICGLVSILLLAGLLRAFGVSLVTPAIAAGAAALLWVAFRHPIGSLGGVLAFMPIFPLTFLIAKFFGPPSIARLEGCDRVVMLGLVLVLLWRNGIKLAAPDWFLLTCFGLATVRFAFSGTLLPMLSDFNFLIAYAAGRLISLTVDQEKLWAKRAVWIAAILAILGMVEVFVVGERPRTALYLSVADFATEDGQIGGQYHAVGYGGLRESSTMLGPLHFAPLCMAALIVWWVYFRNPIPGVMIAAGLICTVTRASWLGTTVAFPFLAAIMGQTKRLLRYAALAVVLFAVSIPVLGLGDYLFSVKKKEDPSAEEHVLEIRQAMDFMVDHPLGVGPGKAGRWALDKTGNWNALFVDDTYLTFATEYGIPVALCFVGFLLSALWVSWRQGTQLGYASAGILVGFGTVLIFFIAHDVFPLACWIWFPVGLAVRSSTVPAAC